MLFLFPRRGAVTQGAIRVSKTDAGASLDSHVGSGRLAADTARGTLKHPLEAPQPSATTRSYLRDISALTSGRFKTRNPTALIPGS